MKQLKKCVGVLICVFTLLILPLQTKANTFFENKAAAVSLECNKIYDLETPLDEQQWYKITTINKAANYKIAINVISGRYVLDGGKCHVYNEDGTEYAYMEDLFPNGGNSLQINPVAGETLYISTCYMTEFTINITYAEEIGNTYDAASNYEIGMLGNDGLYSRRDVDWYVFKTPNYAANYLLKLNTFSSACSFYIYDTDWNVIYNGFGSTSKEDWLKLSSGTKYYVKVEPYYGIYIPMEYTFRIDAKEITTLDKTTITKASKGKNAFTVKWNSVKNAKGYEVRYSTKKNMKKAKVVKVGSAKKLSAKVKRLKKNTKYYIQVRSYGINSKGKKYYAKWSDKVTVVTR